MAFFSRKPHTSLAMTLPQVARTLFGQAPISKDI